MSQLFHLPQAVRIDSTGTPYAAAEANFYLTGTTTRTDTYTDSALSVAHANPVVADSAGQFAAIYLKPSITYRCIITEASAGATIDDVDPVSIPLNASDIAFDDSGNDFTATDVDAALTEIGDDYGPLAGTNTWTADQTYTGADIKMADNIIERPEIKDFGITHTAITSDAAGGLVIDMSVGNSFYYLMTENITALDIQNPPATGTYGQFTIYVEQAAAGGPFTLDWQTPEAVYFAGGTNIVISAGASTVDIITVSTIDAGTKWFANYAQAYATS